MSKAEPIRDLPKVVTAPLMVLGSALLYFYAFKLNFELFDWLEFSHGVNWVFLPSGLRLLLVLVLIEYGSLGIVLASIAINYFFKADGDHVFAIVTGLISGLAPLLARKIAIDFFHLSVELEGLTSKVFFKLTVLFAIISPVLHQLWFFWNGKTENFIASTLVMAVGDWFGTVLVLAVASLLVKWLGVLLGKEK